MVCSPHQARDVRGAALTALLLCGRGVRYARRSASRKNCGARGRSRRATGARQSAHGTHAAQCRGLSLPARLPDGHAGRWRAFPDGERRAAFGAGHVGEDVHGKTAQRHRHSAGLVAVRSANATRETGRLFRTSELSRQRARENAVRRAARVLHSWPGAREFRHDEIAVDVSDHWFRGVARI